MTSGDQLIGGGIHGNDYWVVLPQEVAKVLELVAQAWVRGDHEDLAVIHVYVDLWDAQPVDQQWRFAANELRHVSGERFNVVAELLSRVVKAACGYVRIQDFSAADGAVAVVELAFIKAALLAVLDLLGGVQACVFHEEDALVQHELRTEVGHLAGGELVDVYYGGDFGIDESLRVGAGNVRGIDDCDVTFTELGLVEPLRTSQVARGTVDTGQVGAGENHAPIVVRVLLLLRKARRVHWAFSKFLASH